MTTGKETKRAQLDRLVTAFVDDVLNANDAEILAEAKEDGIDPAATVSHVKHLFSKAVVDAGRARLTGAKVAAESYRRSVETTNVKVLDASTARARLDSILKHHPEAREKLTLAARKGEGLSDADVRGMLEDLDQLGIKANEDNGGDA